MALYEYKCRKCDDVISVSHPINDNPTILCGTCQSKRIKVFSAPAVTFKGNGWGHQ